MASAERKNSSPPPDLAHRIRRASPSELIALLGEHLRHLTMREIRQALLNPHVTAEAIDELVLARHLLSSYEMRRAIARHRRTAEATAMRFISGLFWRDLLEITTDIRIRPAVRRVAEKYLVERLGRLAVGEKISLARRAVGEVVVHLRRDPSPDVIRALLENPRLTEELLAPLAATSTSPRILDLLARNPLWGNRYSIRLALARNTRSPFRVVLPILSILHREDLSEIADDENQSVVIRNRARELLRKRSLSPESKRAIDHLGKAEIDSES